MNFIYPPYLLFRPADMRAGVAKKIYNIFARRF